MARTGFIKTIGLAAVAIVVIGFLIYTLVGPAIGWPNDGRRVTHPNGGFSVVQPVGWAMQIVDDRSGRTPDRIRFIPEKTVGSPGFFTVAKLSAPTTEAELVARKYSTVTFQNQPAYERWLHDKDLHDAMRSVIFSRDGVWFELVIRRPESETINAGPWQAYAESFRPEKVRERPELSLPALSTTLPTSMPSITTPALP